MRSNKVKIVLVGGCFDVLHWGHIKFLEESKKLGDRLVVALESDENVRHSKGEKRPIHPQETRKSMLLALRSVDEVITLPPMKSDEEYARMVQTIHPDIIALTEGDPMEPKKRAHAALAGAGVAVIPKIHTLSTSQLTKLIGLE